ncbi:hypothetical protein DERF_012972 [Dermatophagoides farinae]|uniref:Uncharacterized protein n=1 Tax=Dermatophagoides farinae TaxID=6954 RepID=A0A922KUB8_DERFA|nr:hypothetical protein DERF_012972 [Dermatophagoides farinae]
MKSRRNVHVRVAIFSSRSIIGLSLYFGLRYFRFRYLGRNRFAVAFRLTNVVRQCPRMVPPCRNARRTDPSLDSVGSKSSGGLSLVQSAARIFARFFAGKGYH